MPTTIDAQLCGEKIRWVASSMHDSVEFCTRARAAADDLGPDAIMTLATLFHSEHNPPDDLADQFPGLGDWIAARQFAIFEMFYCFRDAALPVLRHVACGEYDWTQGNAIEVLCRLASEGVERDQIIAEVRRELPNLRYKALIYAFRPLLKQAENDLALAAVLLEFQDMDEYQQTIEELKDSQ